jgi:hypothetical protein
MKTKSDRATSLSKSFPPEALHSQLYKWRSEYNMLHVHMTDPTSRQRGRPKNDKTVTLRGEKKFYGQKSHIWARHQDILTDWPSAAMLLWLWLSYMPAMASLTASTVAVQTKFRIVVRKGPPTLMSTSDWHLYWKMPPQTTIHWWSRGLRSRGFPSKSTQIN